MNYYMSKELEIKATRGCTSVSFACIAYAYGRGDYQIDSLQIHVPTFLEHANIM